MKLTPRTTILLLAASSVIAVAGLVYSIASNSGRIQSLQSGRITSRYETCFLLRQIIVRQSRLAHPPQDPGPFLKKYNLTDCETYAHATQ